MSKSKNINDAEFIVKLTDMMREHQDTIGWSQDGYEVQFKDINVFCEKNLPSYFRHSNFQSFVRQLNVYSFYKTKSGENTMTFKNEIFKKGNQKNYFLIQRSKKYKELQNFQQRFQKQCEQLISQVNSKTQLTPQEKQTIIYLLEYKFTTHVNLRKIKSQIQELTKQLKDSKNKKIQQECKKLKSQLLASVSELNSQSKKIDEFISKNFFKQNQETKSNIEPNLSEKQDHQNFHSSEVQNHKKLKQEYENNLTNQNNGYLIQENTNSFHSFPIFFEDVRAKKQQLNYEPHLYLPFTSQKSFMIWPSYIPPSCHFGFETKMNFLHQNQQIQLKQEIDRNEDSNYFEDDSASMSFIKIYPGQEGLQFPEIN